MAADPAVFLRPFGSGHLDATRAWINDPELMRMLGRAAPVSDAEHERWFAGLHGRTDCVYFAVETSPKGGEGRHVGNVWLWALDWRHRKAELRIVIGDRQQHGRGTGTKAISLACSHAFDALNLHKVYACVLAFNSRARRSFEKAGFVEEGVLKEDRWVDGRYSDVYVLGRLKD